MYIRPYDSGIAHEDKTRERERKNDLFPFPIHHPERSACLPSAVRIKAARELLSSFIPTYSVQILSPAVLPLLRIKHVHAHADFPTFF